MGRGAGRPTLLVLPSGPGRTFEDMERIAVIGCGGSGKTTLSRRLGGLLELPVIHIDGHYWREVDGVRIESTPGQWRACHRELVAGDRWVIDGMKLGGIEERLAAADTAIFLDLPTVSCLWGIIRRRSRFRGRNLPELGVYDRITWPFIAWVSSFRRRQRPRVLQLLAASDRDVIVLRSRREVAALLARIAPATYPSGASSPSAKLPTDLMSTACSSRSDLDRVPTGTTSASPISV
jgi:adenylate kinase family enzyme